jgi:hypothetical protein
MGTMTCPIDISKPPWDDRNPDCKLCHGSGDLWVCEGQCDEQGHHQKGKTPMLKRDELSNPKSCMSRARDDEQTFVLLGRDAAAPAAIRAWVEERIRLGKNKRDDAQIQEACNCADKIEDDLKVAASMNRNTKLWLHGLRWGK